MSMDNENKYISPSCKVIEVKTQTVLCQSGYPTEWGERNL